MQAEFWQQKWLEGKIGFHEGRVNKRLQQYWPELALPTGAPVFVPLCGKSLDMLWLHEQGHPVLGIELSDKAVMAFFSENNLSYTHSKTDGFDVFTGTGKASGITLLAGDYFALNAKHLNHCQAFYDRAALIAMGPDWRMKYAAHMGAIVSPGTKGLLLTIAYDQSRMEGPPFSVSDENARQLLSTDFIIAELAHYGGPERLGNLSERGLETLDERVYLLTRNL